jgi:hypothetical protein
MSQFLGRFHGRRADADLSDLVDAVIAAVRTTPPKLIEISVATDDPYCVVAYDTTIRRRASKRRPRRETETPG